MKIALVKVEAFNRNEMPKEGETIEDDLHVDRMVPLIKEMMVYFRDKDKCPQKRGNWIIDFILADDELYCIKLPKQMTEKQVWDFIKPLTDKLEAYKKSKMN